MGWFGNKDEENTEEQETPVAPTIESLDTTKMPNSAQYSQFARTRDIKPGTEKTFDWMEAYETEPGGKWQVIKCTSQPVFNKAISAEDTKISRKAQGSPKPLFLAMHYLALFEQSVTEGDESGFEFSGKTIEEMGDEYYRVVAEREGMVFDQFAMPIPTENGRLLASGTFYESDIQNAEKSRLGAMAGEPGYMSTFGPLREVFNPAADRSTNLDDVLTKFAALGEMDEFVGKIKSFEVLLKMMLGHEVTRDEERNVSYRSYGPLEQLTAAEEDLDQLDELGLYTQPFRQFVAECEVTVHLMRAQMSYRQMRENRGTSNLDLITSIKQNYEAAVTKFRQMGASQRQIDRLQGSIMVADPDGIKIPSSIAHFIRRNEERREEIAQKLAIRPSSVELHAPTPSELAEGAEGNDNKVEEAATPPAPVLAASGGPSTS